MSAPALRIRFQEEPMRRIMFLEGRVDSSNSPELDKRFEALELDDGQSLLVDLSGLERIDSTGVAVILEARHRLGARDHRLQVRGASDAVRKIFAISLRHAGVLDEETPTAFWDPVSAAGQSVIRFKDRLEELVVQAGNVSYWMLVAPFLGKPVRFGETLRQAGFFGADAVPIVGLIALLIGLIMGMQAAEQLRQFGAAIFVADMVGIATTRELGPLMTAIIVSGRTGSSIAAELGTMVVTEEIDALRTMGLDPVRHLVVPRILALVLVMPCLVAIANVVAIFGGFLIGTVHLGLGPQTYINETIQALYLSDITAGMVKAVVFGAVIANVGVFEGFAVSGGSEEVGQATTRAVVKSILFVIIADAVFTALFYFL
ncbi:MAG: MlaE family lipid ABC transporter permease subunit [Candidatus Eiseniibacteriota bacterium]